MATYPAPNHVDRLPVELLHEVFVCVKALYGIEFRSTGMPACTFLSHVCRRWRQVAIRCQSLWAEIVRPSAAATNLCISRCHTRPLHIYVNSRYLMENSEMYRQSIDAALRVLDRACTLLISLRQVEGGPSFQELSEPDSHLHRLFRNLSIRPSPFLECLAIVSAYGPNDTLVLQPFAHISPATKPKNVLLSGCTLPYPLLSFSPHMVRLTLVNTVVWSTLDEMIAVLQAMPLLEVFLYSHNRRRTLGFYLTSYGPHIFHQVQLRYMKEMYLSSFLYEDVLIYSIVCTSGRARVTLKPFSCREDWDRDSTVGHSAQLVDLLYNMLSESVHNLRHALFTRDDSLLQSSTGLYSIKVLRDESISIQFLIKEDSDGDQNPSRPVQSLVVRLPNHGHEHFSTNILLLHMCSVPHRLHLLQFTGNLSFVYPTYLKYMTQFTEQLILRTHDDVHTLIRVLPQLQSPSLSKLAILLVDTDLPEAEVTLRELVEALESAYLANEPTLWSRLTLSWRPASSDMIEKSLHMRLDPVRVTSHE